MRYRNRTNGVVVNVDKPMGARWEPLDTTSGGSQGEVVCPDCGFVAKSSTGLAAHRRMHDE